MTIWFHVHGNLREKEREGSRFKSSSSRQKESQYEISSSGSFPGWLWSPHRCTLRSSCSCPWWRGNLMRTWWTHGSSNFCTYCTHPHRLWHSTCPAGGSGWPGGYMRERGQGLRGISMLLLLECALFSTVRASKLVNKKRSCYCIYFHYTFDNTVSHKLWLQYALTLMPLLVL